MDEVEIQALIDAAPEGGTVTLDVFRTYQLAQWVLIRKPVTLDANGATLNLAATTPGSNECIRIVSDLTQIAEVSMPLAAGEVLRSPYPGTMYVELGVDPYDGAEPHYSGFIDGGSQLVIPFAINGTRHKVFTINSLAENVTVKNLGVDWTEGVTANQQIAVFKARKVVIDNVVGRFSAGIGIGRSEDVTIRNITANAQTVSTEGGRFVSVAGSRRVTGDGFRGTSDFMFCFVENRSADVQFSRGTINVVRTDDPGGIFFPIFFVTAMSEPVSMTDFDWYGTSKVYEWDSGGLVTQPPPTRTNCVQHGSPLVL